MVTRSSERLYYAKICNRKKTDIELRVIECRSLQRERMGDQAQNQQRPDFNGSNYDDTFVGDLVNFVASNSFQSMFEQYFLSHALYFTDDEEHKLEYMEYYKEFHALFESQLETFCTERN